MTVCKYCGRSGLLLRTNVRGLCKTCDRKVRTNVEAERERIKEALIFARCLKSPHDRTLHLRRAMDSVRVLSTYERLGYGGIQPSPAALAAVLEERLKEVRAEQGAIAAKDLRPSGAPDGDIPRGPAAEQSVQGPSEGASGWAWTMRPDRAGTSERRRASRRRAELLVRLEPGSIRALTEDVSTRGIRVQAPVVRSPGSRVRMTLYTTEGPVSTEGIVRWAREVPVAQSGRGRATLGLELPKLPPRVQARLRQA